jgi:two-component system sensor histidine kinase/response regulator
MNNTESSLLFSEWAEEINLSILDNKSLCLAVFSCQRELIYVNSPMRTLLDDAPFERLLNPSFEQLVNIKSDSTEIFNGYITIGTFSSLNTSIIARVFRKNNKILIIGGADMNLLMQQNEQLLTLNREVNDLQRQLIKEKVTLEQTLAKLGEANHKLTEAVATKDKFFSIIAHDLKNPFNSILGFSELLAEKTEMFSIKDIKNYSQNLLQGARQAYKLLENLLKWARVQNGQLNPVYTRISIPEVTEVVLDLLKENAVAKNINLKSNLQFQGSINTDREMLLTILRNLISNALKFTHPNGTVTISTEQNNDEVIFTVSDNGTGMEPQVVEKLFRIENDYSQKGTSNETGSGLGLILSKEFVEKMNGSITVESKLGEGSTFKFSLPGHTISL